MPLKKFVAAIELGSTNITGIAGLRNPDGSITVNALVKEDSTSGIRKGVVYNIDKTALCIKKVIDRLKTTIKTDISQIYVGVGGQSIYSTVNTMPMSFPESTSVTQEMINKMMDNNRSMQYREQNIVDVINQEFKVDNQMQDEPAGIECTQFEGNFLNILQRKKHANSLYKCFDQAGVKIAELVLAPTAMADAVLTDTEKRSGCILVDLGAETTTIMVYYKSKLRFLAVVPLGGNNITKDIASLQMEESDAEKMKLKHASAFTERCDITDDSYRIDNDRNVESKKFIEIVEARVQEIVMNVWYLIPSEFNDKLVGGMILTGGGANLKNIETAFRNVCTSIQKIRIAKSVNFKVTSANAEATAHDCMKNTILGILAKGECNCAGESVKSVPDLFPEDNNAPQTATGGVQKPQTGQEASPVNQKLHLESKVAEPKPQPNPKPVEPDPKPVEPDPKPRKEPKHKKNGFMQKLKTSFIAIFEPEDEE